MYWSDKKIFYDKMLDTEPILDITFFKKASTGYVELFKTFHNTTS